MTELTRVITRSDEKVCDPITLEIVSGAIRSALREMEAVIERTAMSPFIREKKDFSAALFTRQGKLIAYSGLGASTNIMNPVLERYSVDEMEPGDIYWYNDCYASAGAVSHTPDQVFIRPVFAEGKVVAFTESWAHFNDIGGMRPGTLSPDCTEIFQEGTIIPPVRLARRDEVNDDLLRIFARNSRFPAMVQGDVRALLAAVRLGDRRMTEVFARFGPDRMADAFRQLIDRTGTEVVARMRAKVAVGEYSFTEFLDTDGHTGPFNITFNLTVSDNSVSLDTTQSADQCKGPFNFLMSPDGPASMLAGFLLEGDPRFSLNDGVERVLDEVKFRPGSILAPLFPAPLGLRGVTGARTSAAWLGVLAKATDGNVNASSCAYVICYLRGSDDDGVPFLITDPLGLGYGARPYADGSDGIYLAANENYPAEFVESSFPLRIRRYALAPDSGGPGRWRGGCGIIREIEVLAPSAMLGIRMDSIDFPPWGIKGGMSGGRGSCVINPGKPDEIEVNPVSDGTMVKRGDIIRVVTGGGGGWGHPHDREPELVLEDVLGGFVSRDSAERHYGVAITLDGEIDVAATDALRAVRPEIKLFHRNEYCDSL
ncbi:MAG: hydantoinase B/oxoprolinase family protein [Sphingobium sp.]